MTMNNRRRSIDIDEKVVPAAKWVKVGSFKKAISRFNETGEDIQERVCDSVA